MEIIDIIFFAGSIVLLAIGIKILRISKWKDILLATIGAFFLLLLVLRFSL
jgi:hypothetical protein